MTGAWLRLARPAYFAFVAAILVVAVVPQVDAPVGVANDKVNHILAFFTLALLAGALWPEKGFWRPLLWLAGFGALIEILQGVMDVGRDADWADFVADVGAAVAGLGMVRVVTKLRSRQRR